MDRLMLRSECDRSNGGSDGKIVVMDGEDFKKLNENKKVEDVSN